MSKNEYLCTFPLFSQLMEVSKGNFHQYFLLRSTSVEDFGIPRCAVVQCDFISKHAIIESNIFHYQTFTKARWAENICNTLFC